MIERDFDKLLKPKGCAAGDCHVANGVYRYVCCSDITLDITSNNRLSPEHKASRSDISCYGRYSFGYSSEKRERERKGKCEYRVFQGVWETVNKNFWHTRQKLIWDFYGKGELLFGEQLQVERSISFCSCGRLHNRNLISSHRSFFFFISSPVVTAAAVSPLECTLTATLQCT